MKRKPSKGSEIVEQRKSELLRLVTKHRMMGNQIDEDFAAVLDELHGIRTETGERYTVRSLKNQFTRYMKTSAEETRENFEGYQELQKLRLENLLSKVFNELEGDTERKDTYVLTHKVFLGYLKEARNIISELSTLTGANAPVELLVSGRIESEITLIHQAMKEYLPEDTFSQVAKVLEHVMGLSNHRLGEAERERTEIIDALEVQVIEMEEL